MRRFRCGTAIWHVIARGARRLELFRDDEDFSKFTTFLAFAVNKSECALWAFALMNNHYHLVLRGASKQLGACMHRLNLLYSSYHNFRYGLEGHTFDAPYHAYRQATPLLSLRCLAYVFMNPVKAGLCRRPEDYGWSGYRCFAGLPGSPIRIDSGKVLQALGFSPKTGWARFHQAMDREARRPGRRGASGTMTMVEVHQEQFECLLDYAKDHADQLSGEDPGMVAMYWGRQCGIAPRAMVRSLGLTNSPALRQELRRFTVRVSKDHSLRDRLSPP